MFACPRATGSYGGIALEHLEPAALDDRRLRIGAEHPELARALADERPEIKVAGQVMNPRLHIAMHEMVTTQIWDDDPPETWLTAPRLVEAGYQRHEVLHLLAGVVASDVWHIRTEGRPFDLDAYRRQLDALLRSWQAERQSPSSVPSAIRAERRAEARRRHRGG